VDQKISQLASASTLAATDLIPIVASGTNQKITAGVFCLNQPNIGNSGITKNVPLVPSGAALQLTGTLVSITIAAAYTLGAGLQGQEVLIVNTSPASASVAFNVSTATLSSKGSIGLVYIGSEWFIKSSYNCVIA
jgi:hypothetical protein